MTRLIKIMIILGIETSCDETSAAVIEGDGDTVKLLSNVVASSLPIHKKTGGIIPENAAREQIKFILPVINQALREAFVQTARGTRGTRDTLGTLSNIDAIALTYGPGLIGSLLVGVETAKTISYVLDKPIIPVNHMIGHIYANWINNFSPLTSLPAEALAKEGHFSFPEFPAIALVVSGGHTDLLLMKKHGDFKLLGGTRDDAAGEAFDKIGRLLGLSYPAGPAIEEHAKNGDPKRFRFPRPLVGSPDFDFSFSGLKTAVLREVTAIKQSSRARHSGLSRISHRSDQNDSGVVIRPPQNYGKLDPQTISDLCLATQDAIVDVLTKKTLKAAEKYNAKSILISGGVAANQSLRDELNVKCQMSNVRFFAPAKNHCTDNAAMIASAAYYNYKPVSWKKITANPELYFE